jgi:acyl-CoA reductase-like NAD-dependent aldehyde dehydrogenase
VLKEDATQKVVRRHKPLGVVAAITPWNFPVVLLIFKVAPALLAGITVVPKPAPTTPLTTLRLGELCARVLPAGVVNVIVDQNDLGTALTSHPDVAKVAFTGSTATGKKVMASAAGTLKRLTLELGGNDAAIVLRDIDPNDVAPKLYAAAMFNAGQACVAIKRLYVHDSIHDGARANDTDFGLRLVWSSDRDRAFEVAARINAGTVWVNKHLDLGPDTPYAGAKQSGIGTELVSREGLEEFTHATIINVAK